MRERHVLVGLLLLVAGCGAVARVTRPEGDGGWGAERRQKEVATHAAAAGVALEAPAPEPAAKPLDLPTALALAARGNRRIAEAEQSVEAARARAFQARGRLFPSTIGSGRYAHYTDALHVNVAKAIPAFPAGGVFTSREEEFTTFNGTLTIPLDFSGEIRAALRAAQAGYRGEKARLWATTLEQQALVVGSYYDLLAARRLREVTEQTVALDKSQLAVAQSRFDAGRLTKNDLLVVQVVLSNSEQELLRRDLAIDQARWALNEAIGLAIDAPTQPVDVRARPEIPSVDEALRTAHANNPVLVSIIEEQQRLEATETALARGWLPRVAGGGALDYTTSDLILPQAIGSGFVGFTWDLGTDTVRAEQIAEARAGVARNRIELERDLRQLDTAVRSTQRAAAERLAALGTAESAVGQAEENLRIRQQQFEAGRAQSDDVLSAQAVLTAQRATLATALYEAHTRRAELQQLMGLSLEK
jgi:outer membrane protein